jgi:hypothetical protein
MAASRRRLKPANNSGQSPGDMLKYRRSPGGEQEKEIAVDDYLLEVGDVRV